MSAPCIRQNDTYSGIRYLTQLTDKMSYLKSLGIESKVEVVELSASEKLLADDAGNLLQIVHKHMTFWEKQNARKTNKALSYACGTITAMIDAIRSRDNRLSNVIVALQGKDFKMLMKCMRRPRLLQTSSAITQQFYDDVSEDRNVFKAKLLQVRRHSVSREFHSVSRARRAKQKSFRNVPELSSVHTVINVGKTMRCILRANIANVHVLFYLSHHLVQSTHPLSFVGQLSLS